MSKSIMPYIMAFMNSMKDNYYSMDLGKSQGIIDFARKGKKGKQKTKKKRKR